MGATLTLIGPVRATRPALAAAMAVAVFAGGCGGGKHETPPPQTSTPAPAAGTPAEPGSPTAQPGAPAQPGATTAQAPLQYVPAPVVTQASWAPDALEELLAPIALYPDPLLTQILAASVNSQEVLDAGNWLLQNQSLTGQALEDAAAKTGFGPAMRSLVQFPTVVDMMCQQIDWTRQLGSAFTSDQKGVLDAVQRLRAEAAKVGNLKSTPQQKVETKTDNSKVIVEVKPADPQVVYVPQYDPVVVYTTPPPAQPAQTTTKEEDTVSTGAAIAGGLLAFGVGIMIGNAMDDDYYPNWGYGSVYYGPRPFYPPAYVYRPVYGPAFRPAYGYNPPAGYRNRYNSPTNVVINNNYYNRFDNNRNLQANHTQSPLRNPPGAQNRVGQGGVQTPAAANRQESWKGQSTYAGAKPGAAGSGEQRAGEQRAGGAQRDAARADARTRQASLSDNPVAQQAQANRSAHVDRGYGESTREAPGAAAGSRPERADPSGASSLDRGGSADVSKTAAGERDDAFSGARTRDGGSFDRAASARGRASAGGGNAGARGGGRRR